jgi:hypothetical protein
MLNEWFIQLGVAYSAIQILRLPTRLPLWLDVRRWLYLGWISIETPGYRATAKVHTNTGRAITSGLAGTRVHQLLIWRDTGQTRMDVAQAIYRRHFHGNVLATTDALDDDGREFLNQILEYFQ